MSHIWGMVFVGLPGTSATILCPLLYTVFTNLNWVNSTQTWQQIHVKIQLWIWFKGSLLAWRRTESSILVLTCSLHHVKYATEAKPFISSVVHTVWHKQLIDKCSKGFTDICRTTVKLYCVKVWQHGRQYDHNNFKATKNFNVNTLRQRDHKKAMRSVVSQ